jgi:polyhydroxyalkanoic acid synthase PhaR subunit
MPEGNAGPSPSADLMGAWRDWLTTTEQQWNELLGQTMGTEGFAAGLGQNLDVFLHIQRVMNETMGGYLTTMNVPTRTDVLELGERLIGVESRLAAIEAQLSHALNALGRLTADASMTPARPARTRRPPADPPPGPSIPRA